MVNILRLRILTEFPTAADFAQAASEHESTVSRILRGRKALDRERAYKWSLLLHCTEAQLLEDYEHGRQA